MIDQPQATANEIISRLRSEGRTTPIGADSEIRRVKLVGRIRNASLLVLLIGGVLLFGRMEAHLIGALFVFACLVALGRGSVLDGHKLSALREPASGASLALLSNTPSLVEVCNEWQREGALLKRDENRLIAAWQELRPD